MNKHKLNKNDYMRFEHGKDYRFSPCDIRGYDEIEELCWKIYKAGLFWLFNLQLK